MELSEYNERIDALKSEHKVKASALAREYALSNKRFCIGDIIESIARIEVDSIQWGYGYGGVPRVSYSGPALTKRNIPFKSGERDTIWESSCKDYIRKL